LAQAGGYCRAALYLLARLAGVERDVYQQVLPNRLIVRESSGAPELKS
jgi:hypothetical protein